MKELTKPEIKSIAKGCFQIKEREKGLSFYRFPDSILDECKNQNEGRRIRGHCSTGVVLDFYSNTEELTIKGTIAPQGARVFCYFDLWVDGIFANYAGTEEMGEQNLEVIFPLGPTDKPRHIQLHLPHTREVFIKSIAISDDAILDPAPARPVLLAYGDSITQGMNSKHPSLCYIATAGRMLDMDVFNTGVGGGRFEMGFLEEKFLDQADIITVAFGTNDWTNRSSIQDAAIFLSKLREFYPENKLYILSPVWRTADAPGYDLDGKITLEEYRDHLREVAGKISDTYFIEKELLHPPGMELMHDGTHPETDGHIVYGSNLATVLRNTQK